MTEQKTEKHMVAYTDGSGSAQYCGFGAVYLKRTEDGELKKIYEDNGNLGPQKSHQIAGEIEAAIRAIDYAIEGNFSSLLVVHDYTGIGCWSRGEWQAKDPDAQRLIQWAEYAKDTGLDLTFEWERGHQKEGNGFNNRADYLASQGGKDKEIVEKLTPPFTIAP
jgi:ribonuclease HI